MGKPAGEERAGWYLDETTPERRRRASTVLNRLRRATGGAPETFLEHADPFQLLVAVILSAQNTDANVNTITPRLFARWSTPQAFLASAPGELEAEIRSAGYYNQKARAIRGVCAAILEKHGGAVPRAMEDLLALPGVARKTANVVLSQAFGINEGIAVDTHVHRVAWRLGLTEHADATKVERDLLALIPEPRWGEVTNLLIVHGRTTCIARAPRCESCAIEELCPASRVGTRARREAAAHPVARSPARKPASRGKAPAQRSSRKDRPSRSRSKPSDA